MKKLAVTLSALLLCSLLPLSASAAQYPDLDESHWAYSAMDQAYDLGVLSGMPGGELMPNGPLSWGQYLTMLGRAFYPQQLQSAAGGTHWAQNARNAALLADVLLSDDFVDASNLDAPLSRQDAAVLISRLLPEDEASSSGQKRPVASENLSDFDDLSLAHQRAVSAVYSHQIISGFPEGNFGGTEGLTRAQGTVMLLSLLSVRDATQTGEKVSVLVHSVDADGATVAADRTLSLPIGSSTDDIDAPSRHKPLSPASTISSLTKEITLVYQPPSAAELAELAEEQAWDLYNKGEMTSDELYMQDFWLTRQGENTRKYMLLFGSTEKRRFESKAEAEAAMVSIKVPIWLLNTKTGEKKSSTSTFSIHAAMYDDVMAIFTEIYNDPEQFPINGMGGYAWRGDSAPGEHNCGTAIDINSNENCQIRDGSVMAGTLWDPATNPYSIPADGSVVRVFEARGWSWGGHAWANNSDISSGYHDYMHFSYMGK